MFVVSCVVLPFVDPSAGHSVRTKTNIPSLWRDSTLQSRASTQGIPSRRQGTGPPDREHPVEPSVLQKHAARPPPPEPHRLDPMDGEDAALIDLIGIKNAV